MGSTSFLKPRSSSYRAKSGSSAGSDKEMNTKLKRSKIRRPAKMNEYGLKRIPDYTEMAYKEAVSKLKYFLSGNNPPSVRSYGGTASIKNLDESDGDLDKKYSSSYNSILEYKPRTRLTAKYATLYADSLNSYKAPQPAVNTANPAPQDVTGGTNPDVVNFIQKQEEYIEQLERESQYCRDELNNLLGKVKEVISENEHLHDAQKNKIISRMFHSYEGSETDDLDDAGDSTGLDSDSKQVSPSKARRARSRTTRLEGPNIVFESRISELEAQLAQSKIDLKKVQDENNECKRKLANGLVDSTCLDGFKRQIDNLQRDKSTLESQISKLKISLEQREGDLDTKYKKASDIVEQQLREERNNLETEIRRLKEELSSERAKSRTLAGEGARRAVAERSAAEQRYHQHCDELQRDLTTQYDYVAKMQLDLERQRREENDLKREISMKNSAVEELKMELKNKTATLQADLAQAHAEKASVEEELASARLAIERQQRQAKHETNRLNSEIQSLRQRLDRADADLVHSRRENLRLSEQISNLEKELNLKNLTPISPERKGKDKELSTMLESMENKHAKTVAELESMIQSQNSLMEKLTSECRLLTDKLDDANRRHKEELATLQRQVEHIGRSLQSPRPPSNYKAPPTHATATTRISNSPTDARPEHTGTEPTGDAALGHHDVNSRDPDSRQRDINEHAEEQLTDDPDNQNQPEVKPDETPERQISRQTSRDSIRKDMKKPEPAEDAVSEEIATEYVEDIQADTKEVHPEKDNSQQNVSRDNEEEDGKEYAAETEISEVKQSEQYENPNYAEQEYQNYEQNFEEQQYVEQPEYTAGQEYNEHPEYPNQEYTEQPQYTEQYENYEQYPQQYTDPNTQYEGQEGYENFATDGNFPEQNYDNQQVDQDYAPQYPEAVTGLSESQETKEPNEKVASQS